VMVQLWWVPDQVVVSAPMGDVDVSAPMGDGMTYLWSVPYQAIRVLSAEILLGKLTLEADAGVGSK
jgi:hypothetical protein